MTGPALLFDKSFLQALSLDEAVMLDQMFTCVISPLFFVETMADLAKEARERRRDPRRIVSELAARTPVARGYMNAGHGQMILGELLGNPVAMQRQPAVARGIPVRTDGRRGVVFEPSPETEAFQRWQDGQFSKVEEITARSWRRSLEELDLPGIAQSFKAMLRKEERPRSHAEARSIARAIVDARGHSFKLLTLALEFLNVPASAHRAVIEEWKAAGSTDLRSYAPYAAYCLEVDLYFYLAISNGVISDQRASNRRDIEYLYYLPFATLFVSSDRLHRSAAEHFLEPDQEFVRGEDLKQDLATINRHFLELPGDMRRQGLFTLADRPPSSHTGLCAELWDRHRPGWRMPKTPSRELPVEIHAELFKRSERMAAAARRAGTPFIDQPTQGEMDHILLKRVIPGRRGSWRMFSPEVETENARIRRGQEAPDESGVDEA